jgi:hypothetical protein
VLRPAKSGGDGGPPVAMTPDVYADLSTQRSRLLRRVCAKWEREALKRTSVRREEYVYERSRDHYVALAWDRPYRSLACGDRRRLACLWGLTGSNYAEPLFQSPPKNRGAVTVGLATGVAGSRAGVDCTIVWPVGAGTDAPAAPL